METCSQYASTKIQITSVPLENSFFGLTTPDGVLRVFAYDFDGNGSIGTGGTVGGGAGGQTYNVDFYIQIRPSPIYGNDSLETIKSKVVSTINTTGLFGNCYYDPINNFIWVNQKFAGTNGNRQNVNVDDFSGGEDAPVSSFGDGTAADSFTQYQNTLNFERNFSKTRRNEAKQLVASKKSINEKKKLAKKCNPLKQAALNALKRALKRRLCLCPACAISNIVKDKVAGRNYFQIPFTEFRIPRLDHLIDKTATFDSNRREGEKCEACDGKKKITDVTDDSAKYEEVAKSIEQNSEKILEREAKLGLGGTRTTLIQGSDLLFVGLGFNSNKSYEVVPDGSIAPSMKGGKIPQQSATKVNAVVGKQAELAWPQQVGNYTIKCANKFNLLAGAGGVSIATPGSLTMSSGIMKIVGAAISIGSSNGPLTMEGESVNISGKAISITPSGGECFVKGNINNTGNITTQGHAHFESVSFAKGMCVGVNKSSKPSTANADVTSTQRATWGGSALAASLLDLQTFYQSVPTDSESSSFRLLSPKENQNISNRMGTITKLALPWELEKTGYILPGTQIKILGSFPCNWGGMAYGTSTGIVTNLVELHNIPHMHGIPEMKHSHEVQLPDMDYSNDTPQGVRDKVLTGSHESGIPADPTKDTTSRLDEAKRTAVEYSATVKMTGTKAAAQSTRMK
jgi:hypothetical protein